ncbi:hypothetical protein GGI25_005660 [Coemansia spiralis]|uniref:DUF3020 domain-containing protein n=2 Tax=Coemansia TaxID=4863 RepID=A0A9W8G2V6_9FUNG|nr:hypothetical protein BX070DRAFT_224642 [Coemansia spiralis]KAJ1987658.1 hypothetical protein EDC05_005703 [Coemansia umbellata]KAJ2618749.1 hypothetical protein GGI26_006379 [Coemansia sp. RSA 1358]KAJ2671011.1 hypothetical protein GGI25_005660 [Coemansia spiralis]
MFSSARSFSKQVLNHRAQLQQQTKSQLRLRDDDVLDKMRLENRQRKKRWRELNDERNKDNDLRCRVNKRANQLYGATHSADKEKWIGEEFARRQQRRREKEEKRKVSLPEGFGSYMELEHQVRAASGAWKVTLPPLSSVVPEQFLRPQGDVTPFVLCDSVADDDTGGHAPMTAADCVPSSGQCDRQREEGYSFYGQPRHLRPWEEEDPTADGLQCRSPTTTGADGLLSEAAFSLMSLSAGSGHHAVDCPPN